MELSVASCYNLSKSSSASLSVRVSDIDSFDIRDSSLPISLLLTNSVDGAASLLLTAVLMALPLCCVVPHSLRLHARER